MREVRGRILVLDAKKGQIEQEETEVTEVTEDAPPSNSVFSVSSCSNRKAIEPELGRASLCKSLL